MKSIKSYMIIGVIFVSVLGTLLHFAYEWSGNNIIVGLFAPINESIWEHTKLIFFPMLLYTAYLNKKLGKEFPCVRLSMNLASLLGVILIIALFYTYSGIIGYHVAFVDISIFYISVISAFYIAYKSTLSCYAQKFGILLEVLQVALICMFVIFTFLPPDIPLFINP